MLECSMPRSVVPLAMFIRVQSNVKESKFNSNSRQHCMGHRLEPAGPENSPWLETGWWGEALAEKKNTCRFEHCPNFELET